MSSNTLVNVNSGSGSGSVTLTNDTTASYLDRPLTFNRALCNLCLRQDPVIQALKALPSRCLTIGDEAGFIYENYPLYFAAKQILEIDPEEIPRLLLLVPEAERDLDPLWNLAQRRLYGNG